MSTYKIDFTQVSASPIEVKQGDVNRTSVDVAMFGRINLEYGEYLNENLLHLLENFACPENPSVPGTPDTSQSHENLLVNPTHGQFWYNSTSGVLYFWDGTYWIPISSYDDVAANWGTVYHGQQLPKPISPVTGREFEYSECIWSVAPAAYNSGFSGMTCGTDSEARVTMHYKVLGDTTTIESYVNYLIIGIRGNNNLGQQVTPPDLPEVTPTPTPPVGITVTPTSSPAGTPPPSPPVSPTPTDTPEPVEPLGVDTRLYVSPAPCDPGTPGPGGGTNTSHIDTEGNVAKSAYDQSTYFSLQNISGGVPPYTVDFQNVFATIQSPTSDPSGLVEVGSGGTYYQGSAYPLSTVLKSYFGGDGTGSLRTNISPGEIPYIRLKFDSAEFNTENNYSMTVRFHGRVILTDSVGNTRQWWIPGSSDISSVGYVGGCAAGGTNLTNPGTEGPFPSSPGTLTYWYSSWDHDGVDDAPVTGSCSVITPAEGDTVPAGQIFSNATRVVGYNNYNDNFGSMSRTTSEYAICKAGLYLQEIGGPGRKWLFIFEPVGITGNQLLAMIGESSTQPMGYTNIGVSDGSGNCNLGTRTFSMNDVTFDSAALLPDGAVQIIHNDSFSGDFATRWMEGKNICNYLNQFCWNIDGTPPPDGPSPTPTPERSFTLSADIRQTGGTSSFGSRTTTFVDGEKFSLSITSDIDGNDGDVTGFDINVPDGYVVNYLRTFYRVYYNEAENTNYINQSIVTSYGSSNLSFPAVWTTYDATLTRATVYFFFKPA
jgi:hypothetical protein